MRTTDDIWVVHQWAVFGRLLQPNTDCKYKLTRANNSGLWKHAGITADSSQMLWSYLDKDVQTCSTTLSRLQSSEQSRLINDAPTCTVYHLYSSLAFSKTFIIEKTWNIEQKKNLHVRNTLHHSNVKSKTMRSSVSITCTALTHSRGHQGSVYCDVITLGPKLFQWHLLHTPAGWHLRWCDGIITYGLI